MARLPASLAGLARRATANHSVHATHARVVSRTPLSRRPYVAWVPRRRVSTTSSSSSPPPPLPPSPTPQRVELTDREMLLRLLRRPQRQWYWLGAAAVVGATLVAFGPELKLGVSKHTAEVATKSLQDETLQRNTRELASQIVQTVLNDPKVLDQASFFIQRLVVMDVTRDALRSLVVHTLNDATTLANVTKLARALLTQLLEDAATRSLVVTFLKQTLQDAQTREALLKLLDEIMKDKAMQRNLAQLLAQTFATEPVKSSVATTIGESVHDVLSRPDIQNHAKQFVGTVVQDQTVQAQSGDAIWGTVMYAFTPSWLSWIWEHGDAKEEPEPAVVAAVVAVPAVQAEADAIVGEATEAFGDAIEKRVEPEKPVQEEAETATNEPSETVSSPLVAKPTSRFEMLRRLTMRLPLLSSLTGSDNDEAEHKRLEEEHAKRLAEEQHEHHEHDAAGSGFL